ncbi:MAG: Crp/Fnr family transcriptional regulator [Pseudomonadota bacterium]
MHSTNIAVPSGMRRCCRLSNACNTAVRREEMTLERGQRVGAAPGGGVRIYAVSTGLVALSAGLADGRRQIVELQAPQDVFCGAALKTSTRNVLWAEALTATTLCALDFPPAALGERSPPAGMGERSPPAVMGERSPLAQLFGITHEKLSASAMRMVTLGRLDGAERLCGFLAEMAHRIGQRRGQGAHLTLPMSREDIADYLGLNAETVSRILGRLKKSGLVRFTTPTQIVLPDLAAIEARGAAPVFSKPVRSNAEAAA